jgi:DNA-binding beta-propeller fold protein YncE
MKKIVEVWKVFMYCLMAITCFIGCEEVPDPASQPVIPGTHGVFILCEGNYNKNEASLSYYNFETGEFQADILEEPLGSLGQDILIYGSKVYISVSTSSNITVLDVKTRRLLKKIDLFDENGVPREPRYLTSYNGKVYATCYHGTNGQVVRLDTASLIVNNDFDIVAVGEYPEGIAAYDGKLYVANSGGRSANGPHKTVSVIEIASFEEKEKITVGLNPNIVKADDSAGVYLTYWGNFMDIPGGFQKIDTKDNSVHNIAEAPKQNFVIENGFVYYYDVVYTLDSKTNITYGKYDLNKKTTLPLFTDASPIKNTPYGIGINPTTKDIYIADCGENPGSVYIFDANGKIKTTLPEVGLYPGKFAFY